MSDTYLKYLVEHQQIMGEYDPTKVSGLTPQWFVERMTDMIDFRGDLQIRCNMTIVFGRHISVYTMSHSFSGGHFNIPSVVRRVWIDQNVFIGSRALLYNCHIQEGAVVSIGSVVSGITVPSYTMVEGNPAQVIKEWNGQYWVDRRKIFMTPTCQQ